MYMYMRLYVYLTSPLGHLHLRCCELSRRRRDLIEIWILVSRDLLQIQPVTLRLPRAADVESSTHRRTPPVAALGRVQLFGALLLRQYIAYVGVEVEV